MNKEKLDLQTVYEITSKCNLKSKPIIVASGFCGMCDSDIRSNTWVLNNERPLYELRHLIDIRISRDEYSILVQALEKGLLDNYWRKPSFLNKVFQFFKTNVSD